MAKYLFAASYSKDGLEGLAKAGAANRVGVLTDMCRSLGGSLESFHWAFGHDDVYIIVDLPDDETAAAVSLTVARAGTVSDLTTVKLLTAEQMDAALSRDVGYRPPGS